MITEHLMEQALSYKDYKKLLTELLAVNKTTGTNQSEEYLNYAKINLQRTQRIEKTCVLTEEIKLQATEIKSSYAWLVIAEGWCGDAAQNIPVIALTANAINTIDLKLILRDEHPEIMDRYLTNGSRSIPKLICFEKVNLKEVFVWGPRPAKLQKIVLDLLAKQISKEEKGLITQKWYTQDKTESLQRELLALLKTLN